MLTVASLALANAGVPVSAVPAEFTAVEEPMPAGNVLDNGSFDRDTTGVAGAAKSIEHITGDVGGYVQFSKNYTNYSGLTITNPKRAIMPGIYKFTGYFRMMHVDELTWLRLSFYQGMGKDATQVKQVNVYPTSHEWMKVEVYVEFTDIFNKITVTGGTDKRFIQAYCIDNFSLVPVEAIPEDYTEPAQFGKKVSAAKAENSQVDTLVPYPKWREEFESRYDVQGVIVNLDANGFISGLSGGGGSVAQMKNYVLGYKGSQVTDFMICLCNTNSTFPSGLDTWTDLTDKYFQKVENGIPVDYTDEGQVVGAYKHFIVNGIDYIDIFCETFPTIGINPWISIRMNDLHGHGDKTSVLLSNYYHEHPEYRRVQHGRYAAGSAYYYTGLDFSFKAVRDRMLAYINEALSRYDCYGLELDWQREIRNFAHGDEYKALDIMTEFMHDIDDIIAIYEAKYGHEIKLGIRCASDIETNYEFGLDILTWAADGILDQVIPTGRWDTLDSNIPVCEWTSLLHPFGVTVAPCIEKNIKATANGGEAGPTMADFYGLSASFLSQGADKVALYNHFLSASAYIEPNKHRVTNVDEDVGGTWRHWAIVSTIGSYDKLMTLDRRVVLTYNDTYQYWSGCYDVQLPATCSAGETVTLRIPVGDIVPGSKVTVKLGVNAQNLAKRPTVYVNSKLATFYEMGLSSEGLSNSQLVFFDVPASACNSQYFVIEVCPQRNLVIDYAEVLIQVQPTANTAE